MLGSRRVTTFESPTHPFPGNVRAVLLSCPSALYASSSFTPSLSCIKCCPHTVLSTSGPDLSRRKELHPPRPRLLPDQPPIFDLLPLMRTNFRGNKPMDSYCLKTEWNDINSRMSNIDHNYGQWKVQIYSTTGKAE